MVVSSRMPEVPISRRKATWQLVAVVLVLLITSAAASTSSHAVKPSPRGNIRFLRQVVDQGADGTDGASGATPAKPLAEIPGEILPAGFNSTQLPAETVNISIVLKGITKEHYTARSLESVLTSLTANVTGTPSSTWKAAINNSTTAQANASATQSPLNPQNISSTMQANRSATDHSAASVINTINTSASAEPISSTLARSGHTEAAATAPEASARAVVPAFAQCGGSGGECGRKDGQECGDEAFSGYTCAPGYTCQRENEWYWQCVIDTTAAALEAADPNTIAAYQQCGGQGASCSGPACADAAYASKKCTMGYTCVRQNEYYWQCIPQDINSAESTSSGVSGNRKLLLLSSQLPQVAAAAGRILQQQQQQAGTSSDLMITMSTLTLNPQVVVYRLSQSAAGAAASGCRSEYCSRLAAAGVPVDSNSIQMQPTLAAMTDQVAQASGSTSSTSTPTPAAATSGVLSGQQQQQSGSSNGRFVGTVVGASVGGVLALLLVALGGRRIMTQRQLEVDPKPQYQDQPPVQLPMTQGPGTWQDAPGQALSKDTGDTAVPTAVLQIRTSMSDQDWAKSATAGDLVIDQSQKVAPVVAVAAAAGAAGSSAAAAAAATAAMQLRRSFSLGRRITRSLSFTGLLPGRRSTSSGPAAASGELDPLAEPSTPAQQPAARTEQTAPSPASPLPLPPAAEDDEHHDDFDPDHSARNSFQSRRNSFANRRSFGDPAYRGSARSSGEFSASAYRRGLTSYNMWAQGAVPTGADLAEAVQRNVNSRRSFQAQRGSAARSAEIAGLRPGMHHSHSASDLTAAYALASSAAMAAGAAAAAALEPNQTPVRSHSVQGLPSGTLTPSSVTSGAAASAAGSAVGRVPFGVSSHALSGYASGYGTPSSLVSAAGSVSSRAHDVVISRSDAILTAHALAGLRSTTTTPAGSTAGSITRGPKPQDPALPVSFYALSNFGSGYNTPLARVSAGSGTSGLGPRAHAIQGLMSGFATPSSIGSAAAGTRGSILAPSLVAHALSGLESCYNTKSNTPAGSVTESLARDSAGSDLYRRRNRDLASYAVAGLTSGCATPGSLARQSAGSKGHGAQHRDVASHADAGSTPGCATPSDKASVYSVKATSGSAAAEGPTDHIVNGIPVNSYALSGLASGCTTPGYPSSAAAAAVAGVNDGVVIFNSHALSDAQSGCSSPQSRRSLSTLSYHSDTEYALYRRGFSSYSKWLNDSNAPASDTAAAVLGEAGEAGSSAAAAVDGDVANQGPQGPAAYALSIASGYSSPKTAAAAAAAAAVDGDTVNRGPKGPAAYALSIASGCSSPKSAAAASRDTSNQRPQGPAAYALSIASGCSSPKSAAAGAATRFASHALSNLGSGTMTPFSTSTVSAYTNPAFDGASLRDQHQAVDPSQLSHALTRYYSSVDDVQLDRSSQGGSRRNSTSSVAHEMATVFE